MNKELKFTINGIFLEVLDYTWYINKINALYITHSCMEKGKYAICIATDMEVDEFYYRTDDELKISSEFKKLCSALSEVNPNFKMYFPRCFNFAKVKDIQADKKFLANAVRVTFNSGEYMDFKARNKTYRNMLEDKQNTELQDFKL